MEAKVAHLYKKWEELERDASELQKLRDRLAPDRDYSPALKNSFGEEIEKMQSQKQELLAVVVSSQVDKTFPENPPSVEQTAPSSSDPSGPEKKKPEKTPRKY